MANINKSETVPLLKWFEKVGQRTFKIYHTTINMMTFAGNITLDIPKFFTSKKFASHLTVVNQMRTFGPPALPLVLILSILVSIMLTLIGEAELATYNLEIYVANITGIGMVRAMAPILIAAVLLFRAGTSFTNELTHMRMTGFINHLHFKGIPSYAYLVIPRIIALLIIAPLLYIYSVYISVAVGVLIAVFYFHMPFTGYMEQTHLAISYLDFFAGMLKTTFFGGIIAFVSCYYGLHKTTASATMGRAIASSITMGIFFVIVADVIFEAIFFQLGVL